MLQKCFAFVRSVMRLMFLALTIGATSAVAGEIGDERAVPYHIDQTDIDAGKFTPAELASFGRRLFDARFTVLDGAGRPGATGSGLPTRRPLVGARPFLRTSGPDSNACASCHNSPESGGAGDFVTGVFVGAQEREPVLLSVSPLFSAERGTTEIHGAGLIELLAREMTRDLQGIRDGAVTDAREGGRSVTKRLVTKGVDFGFIVAMPSGEVETTGVDGVDKDLVIRPWSQKGVVTSLRTFTITALNHHHGIQAEERYGVRLTGARDFDRDGVTEEFVAGDVTALTLFQASLAPPVQKIPDDPRVQDAIAQGEQVFNRIGCNECHRSLELENTVYAEPGPYNLEGTLREYEVGRVVKFDLADMPWFSKLPKTKDGRILVRAFTDLKRHRIADDEEPYFANEIVSQSFAPTDEFITRRLWAVGNTGPYGHRGDVTTLEEVIRYHGGEGGEARDKYIALGKDERATVIEFLKSLKVISGAAPEPPNADLMARIEKLGQSGNNQVARRLFERAEAAVVRAEQSADRAAIYATRAAFELMHAGAEKAPKVRTDDVPFVSDSLKQIVQGGLEPNQLKRMVTLLKRGEQAVEKARDQAAAALAAAAFAHPGSEDVPTGREDAMMLVRRLETANGRKDAEAVLEIMVQWSEDLSFRAEQFSQQAALAATRAEAEAGRIVMKKHRDDAGKHTN